MATPEQERFLAQFRFEGPGKRVKPRVRNVNALIGLVQFLVFTGTIAAVLFSFLALTRCGVDPTQDWSPPVVFVAFYVPPFVTMLVARLLMTKLCVRLNWLSTEEARDVMWLGGGLSFRSTRGWPASCCEPHDDLQIDTPDSTGRDNAKEEP